MAMRAGVPVVPDRDLGGAGRDAEGQLDHPPGDGAGAAGAADRDARPRRRSPRRAGTLGARRKCSGCWRRPSPRGERPGGTSWNCWSRSDAPWASRSRRASTSTPPSRSSGWPSRFDWVDLPPQFAVFDSNWVIGIAIVLLRDRVRRRQGALGRYAVGCRPHGDSSARRRLHRGHHARRRVARRAGRGGAARRRRGGEPSHLTKAATRVAANASPEPFSNWVLSLFEDVFVARRWARWRCRSRRGVRRRRSACWR